MPDITNLQTVNITASSARFEWEYNPWLVIDVGDVLEYTITDLEPDTNYAVAVREYDGEWSDQVIAATESE